ncbi:MAG: efflux RND transporter periplasmic adaptor subunit [Pseudomonadales bacterium]|nr:efflux RND transporter periplasmic adaptor subunit [Pseudomonadales bacterium]
MKQFLKISLPFVFLGIAALVAMGMFASRPEAKFVPPPPPTLLVEVAEIGRKPVTHIVRSQGSIAPRTETTLIAEAAGQIVEVSPNFVSGGFFRKGDLLVRIDPRNYASAVKRAKADVARAATQLETERGLAAYAKSDWERLRSVSPTRGAGTDLALRKPQLREAIAMVQSAQADLEKAEGDLERTVIRAPYDGLLRQKIADVGQYVNVGGQLAVTFAVDVAEVRLPVTQQDLRYLDIAKLRANEDLNVSLKAKLGGGEFEWVGVIDRSEGVFDPTSRVLYLVAQIEDPYDLSESGRMPLLMGTFVSAEIQGRAAGNLVMVPRHAMQRGSTLWIVDEAMKIYPRDVNVVRRDEDFVYISEGVEIGERYCLTPIDQPLPGMQIRVASSSS